MNFDAQFETRETHVGSFKIKIILMSLTAIFLICGVLMAIFHPEAEFTWFFSKIEYYFGLFIIAGCCLIVWLYQSGEQREEKYYFTPEGKLDLSIPRYYLPLKRHKVINMVTRKGSVKKFAYDGEGNVYIKFKDGSELTAPLSDLTVSYTMDKEQGTGEFYISKMNVTTPEGQTYKVKYGTALEDSEYNDIFMILSTAGTLKESKMSKAMKWMSKLKDAVDDFDFSDLVGSGIVAGTVMATSVIGARKTADNNVISFVKTKVYTDKKKKSWFKKVMEYFYTIVIVVYIIVVLIVNLAALPEIFGGVDRKYDEYPQELEYENSNEDTILEGEGPSESFLKLPGDDFYNCRFLESGDQFYLTLIPETGEGFYQSPSGNLYSLLVEEENDNRTEFICNVYNDEGWPTEMIFHIRTSGEDKVEGTMVDTDGKTTFQYDGILNEK